MSTHSSTQWIPKIHRATFMALWQGGTGTALFVNALGRYGDGGTTLEISFSAFSALILMLVALYTYTRPDSITDGREPTGPRLFIVGSIVLAFVVVGNVLVLFS